MSGALPSLLRYVFQQLSQHKQPHTPKIMLFVIEFAVTSGRVSVVFKYGRHNTAVRQVSLLSAPRSIVSLLALCQVLTIPMALIDRAGIWLVYSASLTAVLSLVIQKVFVGKRGSSASLSVKSSHQSTPIEPSLGPVKRNAGVDDVLTRRNSAKDIYFAPKLALQKARDRSTHFLAETPSAVISEGKTETYHQVRSSSTRPDFLFAITDGTPATTQLSTIAPRGGSNAHIPRTTVSE